MLDLLKLLIQMEVLNQTIEIFYNLEIQVLCLNLILQEATGVPKYYSLWDEQNIVVAPTPDATYTIQLNYILKDPGLSATNTTTYLSQNFPNGLLYACLVEAYGFLKGPVDMLQLYDKKYTEAVKGFSIEQMGRRRRDEYQAGVPRIGKQ